MRLKRFNDRFMCATTWCFQPSCNLHNFHFMYTDEEIKQIALSHQTWRHEIAQGSDIDVLIGYGNAKCWLLGKVMAVVGDKLQIEFQLSDPEYDKVVDRWSTKIAPAGKKSLAD